MFSYGLFNDRNWNGGDGVIRQFTKWLENQKYNRFTAEFDHLDYGYEMVSKWDYFEDVNYVTIILRKYNNEIKDADWTYDTYLITYYKNRGNTESVLLNGQQVDIDGYTHLLNIIETAGYRFDLTLY